MIILAILADTEVPGQRRAKGKMIRQRVALGVYKYGLAIATANGSTWVGQKYPHKLAALSSLFPEFGIDPEHARTMIQSALVTTFNRELDHELSFEELDKMFEITKRIDDSSGALVLYQEMKKLGKEEEKGE